MKIKDVATYAWNNAIEMQFGNKVKWEADTFKSDWIMKNYPGIWEKGGASGLYWFLIKGKSLNDLKGINTPKGLPNRAVNIAETVNKNISIFQEENLCKPNNNGFLVIYNGHEKNAFARIRSHFALNNNETTAIGFEKYDISNLDIRVRIFHSKMPLDKLNTDDTNFIMTLLNNKEGREAVESTWRAYNGWPVFCKR